MKMYHFLSGLYLFKFEQVYCAISRYWTHCGSDTGATLPSGEKKMKISIVNHTTVFSQQYRNQYTCTCENKVTGSNFQLNTPFS